MCLIYGAKAITPPPADPAAPVTAYKVYSVKRVFRELHSPYHAHARGGKIVDAGTYEAILPVRSDYKEMATMWRLWHQDDGFMPIDEICEDHVGLKFDVGGFHCAMEEADAQEYVRHLYWSLENIDNSLEFVVVRVQVDPKDVIMFGWTPTTTVVRGENQRVISKDVNIRTVVARRIK